MDWEIAGGQGADYGSEEEGGADERELDEFGAAEEARGGVLGVEVVEGSFDHLAQVAGDEGGVVGEASDAAEGGDLGGGDQGDDGDEGKLREGGRQEADGEEGGGLNDQGEERAVPVGNGGEQAGDEDSAKEGDDGEGVADDLAPFAGDGSDAEEDDIAGHGVGEDVAVVEVDDGVEQAACSGEQDGRGEGGRAGGFAIGGFGHSGKPPQVIYDRAIVFAYLRQFFTKSYWRLVRRRQFWLDSWVAIRRSHKDKRGRKQLKLLLKVLLSPVLVLLLLVVLVSAIAAAAAGRDSASFGIVAGLVLGLGFRVLFRRRRRVTISERESWSDERLHRPEVRREIAELTLVYAVLAARAGSESFLAEKTLPAELEVTTRQNHVALLRQRGLWDRLGGDEKELLMRPDGGWDPGVCYRVADRLLEPIRILRWALRIDGYLPTPGQNLTLNFEIASELARNPERLMEGYDLIGPTSLQIARKTANLYFQRGAAEGVRRGYFEPESEANMAWSKEYSERLSGRQEEDILVGAKLVSEADEQTVRRLTSLAMRRLQTCDWLIRVISGRELVGERLGLRQV